MNSFIQKNKLLIIGAIIGAVGGYIYWYYWGCEEGCTIKSVWWRMSVWGAVMGGLLASMLSDYLYRQKESKER